MAFPLYFSVCMLYDNPMPAPAGSKGEFSMHHALRLHHGQKDTNMTHGSISGLLIRFSIPLLLGNLFQQLYNTVDSIVVGQFVSTQALAAVGSTVYILNTLIGFFMGLAAGAGVVISQHYGAREDDGVHTAVHTTMVMTLIMGVLFTVVGITMVPPMLRLMSTPEDVFPEAVVYLRIYFYGSIPLLIYNMGSGILRAVGDSQRPLYFLIVSSVLNVGLDLLFVLQFHMGIAGVAYATVISQIVSAILVLAVLMRTSGAYRFCLKDLHCDFPMLRRIVLIGLPAAIQQGLTAFSNIFVQSYINHFQTACMAGWSCFNKIDQFLLTPLQSISLAATTFVSQNLGANDLKRAKQGTRVALVMSLICMLAIIVPLEFTAPALVRLFNKEAQVVAYGTLFLRAICPFMLISCFNQVLAGALRGAGDTKAPMIILLSSFVVLRQIYLFIISRLTSDPLLIGLGYPFGWVMASLLMTLYYRLSHWESRRVVLTDAPVSEDA